MVVKIIAQKDNFFVNLITKLENLKATNLEKEN